MSGNGSLEYFLRTKQHSLEGDLCLTGPLLVVLFFRAAVQSERKPAGDKKAESPSSQLLTSANLFLRGDLAASAALSASGQNASSPGKNQDGNAGLPSS